MSWIGFALGIFVASLTVGQINAQTNTLKGAWEIDALKIQCVPDGRIVPDANPIEHYSGSYIKFDCVFGPGYFAYTGENLDSPNAYALHVNDGRIDIFRGRRPDQVQSCDRPNFSYGYDPIGQTISSGPNYEDRKECSSPGHNNALVTYYFKLRKSCW